MVPRSTYKWWSDPPTLVDVLELVFAMMQAGRERASGLIWALRWSLLSPLALQDENYFQVLSALNCDGDHPNAAMDGHGMFAKDIIQATVSIVQN